MNVGLSDAAKICTYLLARGSRVDIEALADALSLSDVVCAKACSKLCFDGVLKRSGEYVTVANTALAQTVVKSPAASTADAEAVQQQGAAPRRGPIVIAVPAGGLKVEKGVPLPAAPRGLGSNRFSQWPFAEMAVGDSFSMPIPAGMAPRKFGTILASDAASYTRRIDPSFRVAVRADVDLGTTRVWRIPEKTKAAKKAVRNA